MLLFFYQYRELSSYFMTSSALETDDALFIHSHELHARRTFHHVIRTHTHIIAIKQGSFCDLWHLDNNLKISKCVDRLLHSMRINDIDILVSTKFFPSPFRSTAEKFSWNIRFLMKSINKAYYKLQGLLSTSGPSITKSKAQACPLHKTNAITEIDEYFWK